MPLKRKTCLIAILLLSALSGPSTLLAQYQNNATPFASKDTTVIQKKEHSFFSIFTKWFHKQDKKSNKDTTSTAQKKVKGSDTTAARKKHWPTPLDFTKGGVTYTSLYTQGVNLNTGVTGLYTLMHGYQGFDAFGLPLKAQATAVMNNGVYEKAYSSYSIDFDAQTFLSRLRQRAMATLVNKEADERSLSDKQHINMNDSMQAFESVRKELNSPSYQNEITVARSQLQKDQDSASKNPGMDTTELHSLRLKVAAFDQLEKRYEQLFSLKKNYSSIMSKDTAATNDEARLEKDKAMLNNPDYLEKELEQNHMLSSYEKFLMGVQKFSIGQSDQEISELTLHNFMMQGVAIAYKADNTYISGGYGKEMAVIDPYLMTGANIPSYNRTIEYARVGSGSEQSSNFYATAIRITDPGSASSLGETNWVIDLSKKIVCSKYLDFEGEVAQSFFKYLPNRSDSNPIPLTSDNSLRLAYTLKAHGIVPFTKTNITAEYLNTGGDYITLGNPYLLSGEKMYTAEIMQPIGTKLKLGIGGAHMQQNLLNNEGSNQTDNWMDFSIAYKPNNALSMEAKYIPREFQQQQGTVVANNFTTNMNQLSFTCNDFAHIFGKQAVTTLFVGNFQYMTPASSVFLTQNTNLTYYMLNEIFSLTSSHSIMLSADESRNGWTGSLSQMISEGTYDMQIGKSLMTTMGMQWVEQPGVTPNEAGIVGSIGKSFNKWGRLSLQLNCRNNIERPFYMETAQVIISANASICW